MKKILIVTATILGLAILTFWTPDSDWSRMFEKYSRPESQLLTLENGVRIHFRDFGNKNADTLVLLHGTSDSLLTWDSITPHLRDHFRIISLDLPGHGFSGSHPLNDYSRDSMIESVRQLLDQRGLSSFSLIGNSLGGGLAWRMALDYPERVESLILLNPSGAPRIKLSKSNLGFRIMRSSLGRAIGKKITPRQLVKKSLTDTVVDERLISEELVDRYWELLRLPGNRQTLTELALIDQDSNAWNKINTLLHPTLIIWGAKDQLIPVSTAEKFQKSIPNSQLVIYSEIGHLPMLEAPEETAQAILQFLGA